MSRLNEIPNEVWEVVCIQSVGYCGAEMYERMQATIKKYPEYFPWETKYNSIPNEVHEAYRAEAYPELSVKWEWKEGKGLAGILESAPKEEPKEKSIIEVIQEFADFEEERRRRQQEEYRRLKKIWNKHYFKYKLPYR